MKTLKCSDVGFDCAAVVTAETVEEVLAQAAAHAQKVHGVAVTPEMAEEIAGKIADVA
jgi:predicted small metal-binding protein